MKKKKQENDVGYRIMGNYEITYKTNGFKQNKTLISKYEWDNILKPLKKVISIIEDSNRGKPSDESNLLKDSLKIMFGNYDNCFPEESPLHLSIKNGDLILPPQQGGTHKISWKLIKNK